MTPARRVKGGDRWSHNTVAILGAYATAILSLNRALRFACDPYVQDAAHWDQSAWENTRLAVRCARMLTAREELR